MKHTKTPWVLLEEESDKSYLRIRGTVLGHKYKIANVLLPDYDNALQVDIDESKANAEFIVKAVNLHYPLIEALELAEKTIDTLWVSHHANRCDNALEKVREALAMVKSNINLVKEKL